MGPDRRSTAPQLMGGLVIACEALAGDWLPVSEALGLLGRGATGRVVVPDAGCGRTAFAVAPGPHTLRVPPGLVAARVHVAAISLEVLADASLARALHDDGLCLRGDQPLHAVPSPAGGVELWLPVAPRDPGAPCPPRSW